MLPGAGDGRAGDHIISDSTWIARRTHVGALSEAEWLISSAYGPPRCRGEVSFGDAHSGQSAFQEATPLKSASRGRTRADYKI